jgi:hypothetical protein
MSRCGSHRPTSSEISGRPDVSQRGDAAFHRKAADSFDSQHLIAANSSCSVRLPPMNAIRCRSTTPCSRPAPPTGVPLPLRPASRRPQDRIEVILQGIGIALVGALSSVGNWWGAMCQTGKGLRAMCDPLLDRCNDDM